VADGFGSILLKNSVSGDAEKIAALQRLRLISDAGETQSRTARHQGRSDEPSGDSQGQIGDCIQRRQEIAAGAFSSFSTE
jgi:hypothetical protein